MRIEGNKSFKRRIAQHFLEAMRLTYRQNLSRAVRKGLKLAKLKKAKLIREEQKYAR